MDPLAKVTKSINVLVILLDNISHENGVYESYRSEILYEIEACPWLLLDPLTDIPNIMRRKVWIG